MTLARTRPPRLQVRGRSTAAAVLAALLFPVVEALARRIPRALALVTVLLSVAGVTALVVWASVGDLQHGLRRLRAVAPRTAAGLERRRSWIGDAARQFGLQGRV